MINFCLLKGKLMPYRALCLIVNTFFLALGQREKKALNKGFSTLHEKKGESNASFA